MPPGLFFSGGIKYPMSYRPSRKVASVQFSCLSRSERWKQEPPQSAALKEETIQGSKHRARVSKLRPSSSPLWDTFGKPRHPPFTWTRPGISHPGAAHRRRHLLTLPGAVSAHQLPSHRMPSLPHANSAWRAPQDPTQPHRCARGTEDQTSPAQPPTGSDPAGPAPPTADPRPFRPAPRYPVSPAPGRAAV